MSELVVGLSYRTAPIALLERAALDGGAARALEAELVRREHVAEAVVLSTCNRLEVYADVTRFHGGVEDVGEALAAAAGVPLPDLTAHLYVHYEAAAVAHLFAVASGLESMAVGEQQILGQVRTALRSAQDAGSAGRVLGGLLQRALHVGKRAHSETGLDGAGRSLVEAALERAVAVVGPLPAARVLVVGAGSMSGLVVATLQRAGVAQLAVANRTPERAARLAGPVGARVVALPDLPGALNEADVVVSCTGAVGHVVTAELAASAAVARDGRPQVYLDLALPRDVDPAAAELDRVHVVDLESLGRGLSDGAGGEHVERAKAIVAQEVADYLSGRRAESVAPTVVALRERAREVVEAELTRLVGRVPNLDDTVRAEVERTVHRVVEKLLHTPTVRVKELATAPGGDAYADALRALFDLQVDTAPDVFAVDPDRAAALSSPRGFGGAA